MSNNFRINSRKATYFIVPTTLQDYSDRYDWSEELQGLIMGLFYVGKCPNCHSLQYILDPPQPNSSMPFAGYVLMHIPGALIAERIGGKLVLVSAMAFTTIFTLLTPICVNWGGATALIGVRMAIGTLQGGMWPAVSTILSAWLPMSERNSLAGLAFCGLAVNNIHPPIGNDLASTQSISVQLQFGIIVGNYLTGILLDVYQNWEIVFYVFGAFGVIVTLLFVCIKGIIKVRFEFACSHWSISDGVVQQQPQHASIHHREGENFLAKGDGPIGAG